MWRRFLFLASLFALALGCTRQPNDPSNSTDVKVAASDKAPAASPEKKDSLPQPQGSVVLVDADVANEAKVKIEWKENHIPKNVRWKVMSGTEAIDRGLFYHDGLNPSPKEKPFSTIVAAFPVKSGFESRHFPRLVIGAHFNPSGKDGESKKVPGTVSEAIGWNLSDLKQGKDYMKYAFAQPGNADSVYLIYQNPGSVEFVWYVPAKEAQFTLLLNAQKPLRFSVKP